MRAALAMCDATVIAMRAAVKGITLTSLEVTVESESDDRGLIGTDDSAPAGPLHVHVHVRAVFDAPPELMREVIGWAERHSPVGDALRRSIPTTMTVEIS
jgi:uncharacterized OsmC-like protein